MTAVLPLNCPTCGKPLKEGRKTPTFPFCSSRCKMIDLGKWFTGEYRVSEPLPHEDLDRNLDHRIETDPDPD
ncbi:MAG: DNA gyrase inhibitor YacG [bacterium]|jgi:endogenous inhibitor of DNA gyrase (YacG/DUF329 family)